MRLSAIFALVPYCITSPTLQPPPPRCLLPQYVEDILLRQELDGFAKAHPDRFKLRHQLSDAPPDSWDGPRGRISEKIFKDFMPQGASGTAVAFLCGPDGMQDAATNYLYTMGYSKESVLKF